MAQIYDSTATYPRDLAGYGKTVPHARWPGGARIAVQFVLNFEEGGENHVLHGDAGSETFLSEMFNPASFPARHMSMDGIYDYGARQGVWRILREFEKRNLPLTVFGVATALQRCTDVTAAFKELGHEIACHGLKWIHYQNLPEEVERAHMQEALAIFKSLGIQADGWYTGRDSPNTLRLVADQGFAYASDYYGDDLPFWMKLRKTDGQDAHQLVVPYTLDCNDMRFSLPQGYSHADPFFQYLKDTFDVLYAEGDPHGLNQPKMMNIGMHCRLLGRPGRMTALQRFLDHIAQFDKVWVAKRMDIAQHWMESSSSAMTLTLDQLNAASTDEATALLDGIYEHSPWIARAALAQRPFATLAALKYAMTQVVTQAGRDQQIGLIRAHPELAGKAMVSQSLTAESTNEQSKAGLTNCSAEEFAKLQQLNADYNAKFGWPFILAVRGPRGVGLSRQQIITTFERRLHGHPDFELMECLRNIHRIAEIRLNDKFGTQPDLGSELWDWHESLSKHSDPGFKEDGQLTVTYMTEAHKACAQEIAFRMRECGFDSVEIDVLGNVVGCYYSDSVMRSKHAGELPKTTQKSLLTGSHYDTVRNGGKYDGRLGFFTPMMCVRELHKAGKRLPFGIEVVAFSEEEGQRYKATFLASGALTGHFNPAWLEQADGEGILMKNALFAGIESAQSAMEKIALLKRDPANYLGFVEVHIEQGPVLNEMNLPLGVVTSINGSVRYLCEITGQASHAGTTPMDRRKDAAAAVAELILYVEQRAAQDAGSVGTVGVLQVPGGSINVVPGRCMFSLDLRAPNDAQRSALSLDVVQKLGEICARRGLSSKVEETMRALAAPSAPEWQARWEKAVQSTGLPIFKMPSGAGHDAMKLHEIMPQAMLFVRGENSGISHNPLESTTQDDMQLGIDAFMQLLNNLAQEEQ